MGTEQDAMCSIPYANFSMELSAVWDELHSSFSSVLRSGRYILGPELAAFEREFAAYCQTKFAVGVSSGTCALYLVLRSLGLSAEDEVITVPNSFVATAATIVLAGAKPVFVDIDEDMNIDVDQMEKAISRRTKAIVPVHLTGRPCRMDSIMAIARRHNLYVIEDGAQAVGASWQEKPVGSWGYAGCFSLHPLKNLHAFGDGGVVTTDDEKLYEFLRLARSHGLRTRSRCEFWSHNCRLDELQAALLRIQLRQLDRWTEERRRLAFCYNQLLAGFVEVPLEKKGERYAYQTYMIQTDQRDALMQFLLDNGVEALIHYSIPIHLQPAAKDLGYSPSDFPNTVRIASRILSLPLFPGLTLEQQKYLANLIRKFQSKAKLLAG